MLCLHIPLSVEHWPPGGFHRLKLPGFWIEEQGLRSALRQLGRDRKVSVWIKGASRHPIPYLVYRRQPERDRQTDTHDERKAGLVFWVTLR